MLGFTVLVMLVASVAGGATTETPASSRISPDGVWYLAADVSRLGLPGGALPGIATLHSDGTAIVSDAPELGSLPFETIGSTMHGTWSRNGANIQITALRLVHDTGSGELKGFLKVSFELQYGPRLDTLIGKVWLEEAQCNSSGPTMYTAFNCPDPASADYAATFPFPLDVRLSRLGRF